VLSFAKLASQMRPFITIGVVVLLLFGISWTTGWYGLVLGYFDDGLFEIKQVEWSPDALRVAIVAERSDHEAMRSDDYFVVIAHHVLSATELRGTYYSHKPIFSVANHCLRVGWVDASHLLISCDQGIVEQRQINSRKTKSGGVAIEYQNIADGTAKDFKP
jgi:hypothetical protein